MQCLAKTAICLAGGFCLSITPRAEVLPSNNPYALISTRNIFGLKAPQTAQTPLKVIPNATITPNGIISILGPRQVLFKVIAAGEGGQPSKEISYLLAEGQQQDGIQVMHIDETAALVTFNNHGVVEDIPLSAPSALAGGVMATDHYHPKMVGVIGNGRIPAYFIRGDEPPGQLEIPRTKQEQMQMIENLRADYKSHNDPRANFLPPTALTPTDAPDSAESTPENP